IKKKKEISIMSMDQTISVAMQKHLIEGIDAELFCKTIPRQDIELTIDFYAGFPFK
ncbi:22455_t:CDS:1, partial [Gigaspora rosea]